MQSFAFVEFTTNGWRAGGRRNDLEVATIMIYSVALSSS